MSAERIEMENRIGVVEDEIENILSRVCNKRPYFNYPLHSTVVSPTSSTTSLPNFQPNHASGRHRRGTVNLNNLNHMNNAKIPDDSTSAHINSLPRHKTSQDSPPRHKTSQDSPQHTIIHHQITIPTPPSSPKAMMLLQTVQKLQHSSSMENFHTSTTSRQHRSSLQETLIPNTIYEEQPTAGDNHAIISTPKRKITPTFIPRRSSLTGIQSHLLTRKTSCVNDSSPRHETSSNTEQKYAWFEDV